MANKLILAFLLIPAFCFSNTPNEEDVQLGKYVGFYEVGVSPGKYFFHARAYLKENQLFILFDGTASDSQLIFAGNETFYFEGDSLKKYVLTFKVRNGKAESFFCSRPRSEWPTDLYGSRKAEWNGLAVDTEKNLTESYSTLHFSFKYSLGDSTIVKAIAEELEGKYQERIQAFKLTKAPKVNILIYPDIQTYHIAVLTPDAPDWQMGRAWNKEEIRMLSPLVAQKTQGQSFDPIQVTSHEFIHCLQWEKFGYQQVPGWLWEGTAMYLGCCKDGNPKELPYFKNKKYPSLKQIRKDTTNQLKYELGYYILEYLDKTYGWRKIVDLLESNGDINKTLNLTDREFKKAFYEFMENNYLN